MALPDPRELPFYAFRKSTWKFVEGSALNRTSNGRAISVVDQYNPFIMAEFATRALYPNERRQFSAWKNSLQGGLKSFLAYDQSRAFPIAYPGGVPEIIATTWNGSGITTALSARSMQVSGVPSGYVASAGDHVGLVQDGHYTVHEITEGGTATVGEVLTVSFDPYVPLQMFSIGATAVLWRPKARFVLDPESWEDEGGIDFAPITFTGLQVF